MKLQSIDEHLKEKVSELIAAHWGSPMMITRGRVHQVDTLPGYAILDDVGEILALITYAETADEVEITTLDSLIENKGYGSLLLGKVEDYAKEKQLSRVCLITTNDNTRAMRFYQRRGYKMSKLYFNAVHEARKLKPEIPLTGFDGIAIEHEIELVKSIV
jgi:GNAT superfamily N-acetyltransferase